MSCLSAYPSTCLSEERGRETDFKELPHVILGTGESKPPGEAGRLELGEELMLQTSSKVSREAGWKLAQRVRVSGVLPSGGMSQSFSRDLLIG